MKIFLSLLLSSSLFAGVTPPSGCTCDTGQAPKDKGQAPQAQVPQSGQAPKDKGQTPPGDQAKPSPTPQTGKDAQGNPCACEPTPAPQA